LGVKRKVVAEYAGGLLGGNFGEYGDIVEDGGDIVDE
jgi:hypothetical protein